MVQFQGQSKAAAEAPLDGLAAIAVARAELAAAALAGLKACAPGEIAAAAPLAEARLSLRLAAGRIAPEVREAADAAARARAALDAFRAGHDLTRPAIYPDSRVLQAGLLLLAAGFEAAFSAALFAETEERGLLGGAMIALGLSGANVSLGFLSGFLGLRYLGHRTNWTLRALGGVGLAALFALSAGLNLYAAAWRNAAAPKPDADRYADFSILDLSPQAIILLMLGASVWVFAALKGYSGFDDPYPDYGKLDRARAAAEETLTERRKAARAALEAPVDAARAAIAQRLADAERARLAMRARFDQATGRHQELAAAARKLGEHADEDPLAAARDFIDQAEARLREGDAQAAESLNALADELDAAAAKIEAAA